MSRYNKQNNYNNKGYKYNQYNQDSSELNQKRTEVFNKIKEFDKYHPKNYNFRNAYKTSMCTNEDCYYGKYCKFAHNKDELRNKICLFYHINRSCNRGKSCDCEHSDNIPDEVPILTEKIQKKLYEQYLIDNDCPNKCLSEHRFEECVCGTFVIELDSDEDYEDCDDEYTNLLDEICDNFSNCKLDTIKDDIYEKVTQNIEVYDYIYKNLYIPSSPELEIYLDYIKENGPINLPRFTKDDIEPQPLPEHVRTNIFEHNKQNPEQQIDVDKFYYHRCFDFWALLNNTENYSLLRSLNFKPKKQADY